MARYTFILFTPGSLPDVRPNNDNQVSSIEEGKERLREFINASGAPAWATLFLTKDWDGIYFGHDPVTCNLEVGPRGGIVHVWGP